MADRSGIITVTTAGTAVQGPNVDYGVRPAFLIKAHPDNTDTVWVGNVSDDVANTNGFPLNPGETMLAEVRNLKYLWFDSDVNGEKICWFAV